MSDGAGGAASRRKVLTLAAGGLAVVVPALADAAQPASGRAGAAPASARPAPPPIPQDQAGIRAWYDRYIDAFNRDDFETFSAYYTDDITFEGGGDSVRSVSGLAAVMADFRAQKSGYMHQTSNLIGFVGSPDRISVEFHVITIGLKDGPASEPGSLKKGERRESINFAIYDLKDGRFRRARFVQFQPLPAKAAP